MGKAYAPIVHHFLKLAILIGFTAFTAYLTISGDILLFIAPQLTFYVNLAVAGLAVFTAFQLYFSIRSIKQPVILCDCGHGHDHSHSHEPPRSFWKHAVIYSLFMLPLLLGTLLPNQALAGSLAKKKGMTIGGGSVHSASGPADLVQLGGDDSPAIKELFKADKYNRDYAQLGMRLYKQDLIEMKDEWFIEKLQALNTFPANFEGKPIKIKGFIYREAGLQGNQLIIGRMAMTHCIADVSPYGIVAETPDASQYADDSWVTVTGTIGKMEYRGQTVIKITVQSMEPAAAPSVPYVYPDWDFASKLK
ncbi:TIGR03943 family protein [Paenibacillus elgii]|uniref:TIGR03943 family protein n=1 Tax=Paenibacillus elgii TaxID=189691 RepID=A0A2T6G7T7_9BACL|nr:TIGR03943 family protein [Paenibacillus elgii]PUA40224.1 TIGR03943 family protein [Paenibacillus elgii]